MFCIFFADAMPIRPVFLGVLDLISDAARFALESRPWLTMAAAITFAGGIEYILMGIFSVP